MQSDRIRIIEPYGNGKTNRELPHGQNGGEAFRELKIHHPNANASAVRAGDPSRVDRTAGFVEGELEAIRTRGDRNGIPLVSKDLILATHTGSRDLMIPNPVAGYVEFRRDKTNAISIWSGPPSDPNRELLGQVLHGARGSSSYKEGDFVPYGAPLVRQSDVGSRGAVHAHIELEPDQYRRYLGDILNDRITLSRHPAQGESDLVGSRSTGPTTDGKPQRSEHGDAPREPVLKLHSHGPEVWGLQTTLRGLGYTGTDGQPLKVDSDFGSSTDKAVRDFQRAHGLEPVDGKVGKDTRAALAEAAEHPLVSEATHPNHKLYAAIGAQLPAGTDPKAIANVTMQALENRITSSDKLAGVTVQGTDVTVFSTTPGFRPQVDLTAPTGSLQSMSDHMARQTQERVQEEQRRQQVQAPQTVSV